MPDPRTTRLIAPSRDVIVLDTISIDQQLLKYIPYVNFKGFGDYTTIYTTIYTTGMSHCGPYSSAFSLRGKGGLSKPHRSLNDTPMGFPVAMQTLIAVVTLSKGRTSPLVRFDWKPMLL